MIRATRLATRLPVLLLAALLAPGSGFGIQLPPTREVRLPNGVLLILAEKHDVPMIAFDAILRSGSIADPPGKEGVASLTVDLVRKGAGRRSAQEIAALVDGLGASLDTGAGLEHSFVSGEFMARDQGVMLDLLADVLRRPTFPNDEFEKLKSQTIDAITAAKDDPQNVLGDYADAFFYGNHPYARPSDGDEATNRGLTREDVLRYYHESYGGDRLIVSVVGDFDSGAMESKIRAAFGDWAKTPGPAPEAPPVERRAGRRVLLVDKPDATQTYFWIGNIGIARLDPDRIAFSVATTAYGGRFTSILNTALRIEGGLTYGARVRAPRYSRAGTVAIVSYTKTESTEKAVDMALRTLEKLRSAGVDSTTLASSRTYMIGQYPPTLETAGEIAGAYADLAFYGQPREDLVRYTDRVAAVSADEVRRVITRVYPPSSDLTFVFVGKAVAIRKIVGKYGPVTGIPITDPMIGRLREGAASSRGRRSARPAPG
jgi:predicted Zn-dependent peptidase